MRSLAFLLIVLILSGNARAGTVCVNGRCFSCEGSAVCVNGACTCNGVIAGQTTAHSQQGPCADQEVVVHKNGGGKVAITATVSESAFVSPDSSVCGHAVISGPVRLLNGTVVNGNANISGQSTVDQSTINGSAMVAGGSVTRSTLNGSASAVDSEIRNSVLNGSAAVESSRVTASVLNGGAKVVRQNIDGQVLNN